MATLFNFPANTEPKNNVVATLGKPPNNLLLQKPLYNVIKTFYRLAEVKPT